VNEKLAVIANDVAQAILIARTAGNPSDGPFSESPIAYIHVDTKLALIALVRMLALYHDSK
jgi:hypothetical protein